MAEKLPLSSLDLPKVSGKPPDLPRVVNLFCCEVLQEAKTKKDKKAPKRKTKGSLSIDQSKKKKSKKVMETGEQVVRELDALQTIESTSESVTADKVQAVADAEVQTEGPFCPPPEAQELMDGRMEYFFDDDFTKSKSTVAIRAEESLKRAQLAIVQEFIQHAVVKRSIERCDGCKIGGDAIHTTCEQPFFDVWRNDPASVIRQIRMWDVIDRWYQFVQRHMHCLPDEVHRIYGVCCPSTLLYTLHNKLSMQPPWLECNEWRRVDGFVKENVGNYNVCHFFIDIAAREFVHNNNKAGQ